MSTTDDKETAMITYVDPEKLQEDLKINLANITESLANQTSNFIFYASQCVRAKRQYERYKLAVELLESRLDAEHRTILKEESSKATEPQVKAAVINDPRYKVANRRLIDAQQIYRLAEIAERAFDHRKDMILQIARDASKEREGQLRVVANGASKERLMDLMARGKQPETTVTPD